MKRATLWMVLVAIAAASSLPGVAEAATLQRTTNITLPALAGSNAFCDGVICRGTFRADTLVHAAPFHSTLGELTGVAFQLFYQQSISASVECTSQCPFGSSSAELSVDLYLNDFELGASPEPYISIARSDSRLFSCANGCTHNYNFDLAGGLIIGEDISRFSGPTTTRFRLSMESMLEGSSTVPPEVLDIQDVARLVTTYVYTPVPEPGTGMMLAAGVAMLALRRNAARRGVGDDSKARRAKI